MHEGKNRPIWKCYKCSQVLLLVQFNIHSDYPAHHGLIYPINNIDLLDVNHAGGIVGSFDRIREMEWKLWCFLLEIKGGGLDIEFEDPDTIKVLHILACVAYVEFEDESTKYYQVIEYINTICTTTTKICELITLLP